MSAQLRGHHLICLQFYRGEGYSDEFVANLDRVQRSPPLESPALVVSGPDDVCAACPGLGADGTCRHPDTGEAEALRIDALALQLARRRHRRDALAVRRPARGSPADAAACDRWRAEACAGCLWADACADGWADAARRVALGSGRPMPGVACA